MRRKKKDAATKLLTGPSVQSSVQRPEFEGSAPSQTELYSGRKIFAGRTLVVAELEQCEEKPTVFIRGNARRRISPCRRYQSPINLDPIIEWPAYAEPDGGIRAASKPSRFEFSLANATISAWGRFQPDLSFPR
jgi:hypothetical protein